MTVRKKKPDKELPGPCSLRQLMYMKSEADVTLFGGAAGSGKSEIGMIDLLQYIDIPNFVGVLTRLTSKQFEGPGGLVSKCKDIFTKAIGPEGDEWIYNSTKYHFKFFNVRTDPKTGKKTKTPKSDVFLRHFQHDKDEVNWQGIESSLIYVDEGTQYNQFKLQYMLQRLRNPRCSMRPRMKITCNPDADHILRKFVEPYLHEDGTPDRSKDGLIRYFGFHNGDFVFGDTKEELEEKYAITQVMTFTFISATIYDNPVIMKIDPGYVARLEGQTPVEKARKLHGNWYVRETASGYFKREWLASVRYHEQDFVQFCRAWDIAGTLPSDANPNPDWTAGVLIGKTKQGRYVVCDVVRFRARYGEVIQRIIEVGKADPSGTLIRLPQEPGQAGKAAGQMMVKELVEEGLSARLMTTNQKKVHRFQPFACAAEAGLVDYCDDGDWVGQYFFELELFDGTRKNKDDQVDATSDAFISLAQKTPIPDFLSGMVEANASLATTNPFH